MHQIRLPRLVLRTVLALLAGILVVMAPTPPSARAEAGPTPEAAFVGITQLDAGQAHTCARLSNGQARCWGKNLYGNLGDGSTSPRSRPTTVLGVSGAGPLTGVVQIRTGGNHTCARVSGGQVRCWGYGIDGQLGNGSASNQIRPVPVLDPTGPGNLSGVTGLATGWDHTCAVLTSGQARCWGNNERGQLGDGTITARSRPVVVGNPAGTGPLTGVRQITAGQHTTCARLASSKVMCWGENANGQLGDNTAVERHRPVFVTGTNGLGLLRGVTDVVSDSFHTCVRLSSGQARCWGANSSGELSDGSGVTQHHPVTVTRPSGAPLTGVRRLALGLHHTCVILVGGQARCAGDNALGQLGDRTYTVRTHTVAVLATDGTSALAGAIDVAAGFGHTCVLVPQMRAVCVGDNLYGQLGDGTTQSTARPVGVRR